jgi:hypothetical protein
MRRLLPLALLLAAVPAFAKLPPLSDEAKAKAAEAAAKTAWSNKVADFQLCNSMNKVAARYLAEAQKAGKALAPTTTPACADPGPFAYTPPEAKPIEAAGAHSPPATAATPPSTTQPAAAAPKPAGK